MPIARPVVVVDYGAGNLLSVARAFRHIGAEVILADDADTISRARRLILPGVGAFGKAMDALSQNGLVEAIRSYVASGRPFLGICLGMEMMLESSEEFGLHEGLGLIPGRVLAIPKTGTNGSPHKVPHIGWNGLKPAAEHGWRGTILDGIPSGSSMYFVHSFTAHTSDPDHCLAVVEYNGHRLCAALQCRNLYGFQCHPEKSGTLGLSILERFLEF